MMMPRFTRKFGPILGEAATEIRPGMSILANQDGGRGAWTRRSSPAERFNGHTEPLSLEVKTESSRIPQIYALWSSIITHAKQLIRD